MSKAPKFTVAVFLAVTILAALFIHSKEEAYHLYYKKYYVQAEKELKELVNSGDGFAAYLIGQNRDQGRLESLIGAEEDERASASLETYLKGARLGNIEAAASYLLNMAYLETNYLLNMAYLENPDSRQIVAKFAHKQCMILDKMMSYGSLTGNLVATFNAAMFYLESTCSQQHYVKAAYYFGLSRQIDPRLAAHFNSLYLKMTLAEQEQILERLKKPIKLVTVEDYFLKFWASLKELQRK